jgi:tetratricopeptide (TPR) repeat protein
MLKLKRIGVKPKLHRETCLILLTFVLLITPLVLSGQGRQKKTNGKKSTESGSANKANAYADASRALILTGNFDEAVTSYALLLEKDSTNITLNAEYAYALALNGIYDAALSRLDHIWSLRGSGSEVNFFVSQVFALMGYNQLAGDFWKGDAVNAVPAWISSKAPEYLTRYRYKASASDSVEQDDVVSRFKRANRLAAQNSNLQSIALFEEITGQYPGEYIPYVGYSIALEKASMYNRSALTIEKALTIVGESPENSDARKLLNQRLVTVRSKIGSEGKTSGSATKPINQPGGEIPRFTAYAGGIASESFVSLSAKIGTYKTGAGSTLLDLGLTSVSGSTSFNVGVLSYFRQKIFVGGYGLSGSFGGGSSTIYAKVSLGISLMNRKRSASFDVFLDGQQPLAPKGAATVLGMSVGRSVYFGKR